MKFKRLMLKEAIDFNPKESLAKGTLSKKISMDLLKPFHKFIESYYLEIYSGGAKFRNNDTIMARITPCLENGKTSFVDILNDNEVGFGSTEYIVLRSKENITIPGFVYYLSISKSFREKAISLMTGTSGRQRVELEPLKELCFSIPSIKDQNKIVKILSSIDNKIKLNNQINNNLYEIVSQLYQNLFVDGEWEEIELKDIANISSGKRPKEKLEKGVYPIIGANGIMGFTSDYNWDNDIIITGRVGTLGIVKRYYRKIWASDNTLIIETKYTNFVENYLKTIDYFSLNRGSTQPLLTQSDLKLQKLLFNKDIIENFELRVKKIINKIRNNDEENEVLGQLRDTLLPKLMNGEIDLEKIEI